MQGVGGEERNGDPKWKWDPPGSNKNRVPTSFDQSPVFAGAPCLARCAGNMAARQSVDIERGRPRDLHRHTLDWTTEWVRSAP